MTYCQSLVRNLVLISLILLAGFSSSLAAGRKGGHAMHPQSSTSDCGKAGESCKKQGR